MKNKFILSLLLVFVLAFAVACGTKDDPKKDDADKKPNDTEELTPDLDEVPDVVAEVNDIKISKDEFTEVYLAQFQQAAMQAQFSGQELDEELLKETTVDMMINSELLLQAADNGNFKASQAVIDESLASAAIQSGFEDKDEFIEALIENGMTKEDINEQLEKEAKVSALIESETGEVDTSDEALNKLYEEIKAQQEEINKDNEDAEEFPSFEEAKDRLIASIEAEKQSETIQILIEKYREDADITIHL